MTPPERPEPISEHGNQPPTENTLPVQPATTPNPLFDNLVPATPHTRALNKTSFAQAMPRMGMSSVFDIIRQPKAEFTRQLRTLSDADGDLAYDNALCYATQIARSYREDVVSSGRDLPLIAPQTGVRALVDIGPSYPNLFKENWDQFCKVGAIEAMDGPVAYLGSLRRFAAEKIEGASTSPLRIPLAVRRPDLDALVIDEQSTYQSVPMLDLVNIVLSQGIAKYQTEKGDARPIHQLLAEKKHPFVFPYHFAHQQVSLALDGDRPRLGEINYRLAGAPAASQAGAELFNTAGQLALAGLNPALQTLVLAPSLFSHMYVGLGRLLDRKWPYLPGLGALRYQRVGTAGFLLQAQPGVHSVTPAADRLITSSSSETLTTMVFSRPGEPDKHVPLTLCSQDGPAAYFRPMNHSNLTAGNNSKALQIRYLGDESALRAAAGLECTVIIQGCSNINLETWRSAAFQLTQWSVTFTPEHDYALTPEQSLFFMDHYGLSVTRDSLNPLTAMNTFAQSTSLAGEQIEALLAVRTHGPIASPNYVTKNRAALADPTLFPASNHYGACYVNGMGGVDAGSVAYSYHHNAIGLVQFEGSQNWHLSNTSLERFDRLQRMIRLQKATGLAFAELDTLIISAIRSEADANPSQTINHNTLRTLGMFRYFNREYGINAHEFAALVYHVTPFASAGQTPLLDKVFNTPMLFGTPLVIDDEAFSVTATDALHQQTVAQLCAGLGTQPGLEFERMVGDTLTAVPSLKRSLAVVSCLYRQARIAQMFGLSISDCWALTTLLGGSAYRGLVASGRLKALDAEGKDILDVLMELDWAVRWLKSNKLTVTGLHGLLTHDDQGVAPQGLLERLQQLAGDTRGSAVTPAAVAALGLPNKATGAVIDWHAELGRGAQAIVDGVGLVKALPATLNNEDSEQLASRVHALVATLGLAAGDVGPAQTTLTDFLLDTMTRQHRLVEGLLQEHIGLLPELAAWVARCAEVTPHQLLSRVYQAWPQAAEPDEPKVANVLADLERIGTCARAITWANTGSTALRTFVVNPTWLGTASLWPHTLPTLHLLKAYASLFNTLGQPEERLLGYLQQANAQVSRRPGKRQLAVQSQTCNAALASLLGWSESEVAVLTALLPQQMAKTVAHIDWVRRAQALSLETGLDAATLLKACSLNADSPEADWQTVGQAAMAAVSR
jgi:hypothetical protein